jgi:histidyl-tRNA synthetase
MIFEHVRESLIRCAKSAGYQLIELPVFEDTDLFKRGVASEIYRCCYQRDVHLPEVEAGAQSLCAQKELPE